MPDPKVWRVPRARERLRHPSPRRRGAGGEVAAKPPSAHWDVQTVQRDVEGVLAPVWLVQADDAGGELLVTPGFLQIQTRPAVSDAALDPVDHTVETTGPTFVENR